MVNESAAEGTDLFSRRERGQRLPKAGDLCMRSCVSLGGGNHYSGPAAGVCAAVGKN